MRLSSARRRLTAIFTIASLAFAQGAVAMHACALPDRAAPAAAAPTAPPCHEEAPDPAALCKSHCEADRQTVDHAKPLGAADVVAPLLAIVEVDVAAPNADAVRAEPVLARAAAPPFPILYHRFLN